MPEMFFQLECLNFLRQVTYKDEYDYTQEPNFQGGQDVFWRRIDVCLQTLRRAMMCVADTTPWLLALKETMIRDPDLDTLHYCRNSTKIIEWTNDHGNGDTVLGGGLLGYVS
jgi:hypothetical protein